MAKSATFGVMHLGIAFGVMHLGIAFGVSYALTGSITIAGAITLVEPLVNTVAHYFFDRWWGHPALKSAWARWTGRAPEGAPA
jgi:uncharacterized membrane protein